MDKQTTEPMAAPVVLDYDSPKNNPRPARSLAKSVFEGIVLAGVTAVTAAILIPQPTRLSGAQRSVKIKWEQRQQEIERTVQTLQSPEAHP